MPSNVAGVSVVNRDDTAMILQWNIVANTDNNTYNYTLKYRNELSEATLTINTYDNSLVKHEVSGLIPATTYSFILYTIFDDVRSTGFNFTNSTSTSLSPLNSK